MQSLDEEVNDIINDEELVDSEDEREAQEEQKEKFDLQLTFTTLVPQLIRTILVAPHGNAQALSKIILGHGLTGGDRLKEIGKVEVTYHEKTQEVLKILHYSGASEGQILVLHPQEALKSTFVNQLVDKLFGQLKAEGAKFDRIVILDSIYKTNYSTTDTGYLTNLGDHYPLKYYRTSHANADQVLASFTSKIQPAGVLNLIGGLNAAILIHAELNGIPAAEFVSVVDSHYVTSETLQAFTPIVQEVLGFNEASANMNEIHRLAGFKEVLKEVNNRNNNIFN
eukprot:403339590